MENKIEDNLDDILAKLLGNEKLDEEEKKRAVLSRETIARAILRQSGSSHLIIKATEDVNSDIHYIVNHEPPTNSSIFYRLQQTLGLISNQNVKKLFYHRYLAITQQAYSRKVLFINLASFNPLGGWSWGTMIGENKIGKFTTPDNQPISMVYVFPSLQMDDFTPAVFSSSERDEIILNNSKLFYWSKGYKQVEKAFLYDSDDKNGTDSAKDPLKEYTHLKIYIYGHCYAGSDYLYSFRNLDDTTFGVHYKDVAKIVDKYLNSLFPDTKPKNIAISLMACEAASGTNKSSSFAYKLASELYTKKYNFYIKADTKIQTSYGTYSFGHCKKIFIPHNGEILVEDLTTYLPYQTYKMIVKIYNEKTNNEIKKMLYPILDLIEGNNFVLTTNDKTAIVSILNDVLVASKNSNDTNSFFYKNNDKILQQYITQLIRNFKPETTETSLHSSRVIHI